MPKNPKRPGSETLQIHPTAGAAFADRSMLEIVRRNPSSELELLVWNGSSFEIRSTVAYGGKRYAPEIPAHASVFARLTLPSRAAPYVSINKLFTDMCERFRRYSTVSDEAARLLTYSAIASWFPESLVVAPCLSLASPAPVELVAVLQLLSCFCRHAILLGEVSPLGLHGLPWDLQMTLLINHSGMSTKTQRFLNVLISRRGSLSKRAAHGFF